MPGQTPKPPFSIARLDAIFKGEDKPQYCIIRRLGGIGDVLMTTPLCRGLKKKWPGCRVTYATDPDYMGGVLPDILKYNPYIDEVIPYQILKGRTFDATADVTSICTPYEKKGLPPINRVDLFSHASGIPLFGEKLPVYVVTQEEKDWAQEYLSKYIRPTGRPVELIGVQVRSNSERRNWPIEQVRMLVAKLTQRPNTKVIVFETNKSEAWNMPNVIPVVNFKIRQAAALIDATDIMICHDSGLLHLAGALEKRTVSLFGSTDPAARINYYKNAVAVENKDLQCLHCWYASCKFKYLCMKSITVEEVYDTAVQLLNKVEIRDNQISISVPGDNVVIVKRDVGGIGDMITLAPVLRGLREQAPAKQIHLMIPEQYKPVFENNPYVDKILDLNERMYNYYTHKWNLSRVCAQHETSTLNAGKKISKTRTQIFCDHAGVKSSKPELFLSKEEKLWAKKFLRHHKKDIIIGTALRSAEAYRDWPIEYYHKLFGMLDEEHKNIKFLILDQERKWDFNTDNIIDGAGFGFRKFISLVDQCDMILTPDTSLLHVAGAFNKKTIALFGPIGVKPRCDLYSNTRVITDRSLDCLPCWRNAHIPCTVNGRLDESMCMENIEPIRVANIILEEMENGKKLGA
jgi:ADP-heptose:LPS heptosyltransferase